MKTQVVQVVVLQLLHLILMDIQLQKLLHMVMEEWKQFNISIINPL